MPPISPKEIEERAAKIHKEDREKTPEHKTTWKALKALGYHHAYMTQAKKELKRERGQ